MAEVQPIDRIAALEEQLRALRAERDEVIAERNQLLAERDKLRQAYERLKEQYLLLKRRIFVAKAERIDVAQLELEFAETKARLDALAAELGEAVPPNPDDPPRKPEGKPKPSGRRRLQDLALPEERVELLDPLLEGRVERIGFELSYRLGYRRGGPVRIVVARATYKREEPDGVELMTVDKPKELYRRGLLAPSIIARVLVSKYCFGMPFHRQAKMLAAEGVELDDGTMCRYAEHIGASLGGIVDACAKEAMRTAFCLSTDATGVAIRPTPLPSKTRQNCHKGHFFVVLADEDHVFFEYQPRHTSAAVCEMFRGFSGNIQVDASAVYNALFRGEARAAPEDKPPDEVGCWSHCRRGFWETETATKDPVAREALLRIRKLFELEAQWKKMPPSRRLQMRQQVAAPLVGLFFEWVHARYEEHKGTRGLLRSALGYAVRQEEALRRFLTDGRLKMTNNDSERALRTIAVGRKAWLFFGSDDHATSAANLFSLIASCRLHNLDAEQYLAEVIRVMPYWPRTRYIELAPKYWASTRARLDPDELARPLGPITVPAEQETPPGVA